MSARPFLKKTAHEKMCVLLQGLFVGDLCPKDTPHNAPRLGPSDLNFDPVELPSSLLNDTVVDVHVLEPYLTSDAWDELLAAIDVRRDMDLWPCPRCDQNTHDLACIECDGCLEWFHMRCAGFSKIKIAGKDAWFCMDCDLTETPQVPQQTPMSVVKEDEKMINMTKEEQNPLNVSGRESISAGKRKSKVVLKRIRRKPVVCEICHKVFCGDGALRRHEKLHKSQSLTAQGRPQHACRKCDKVYRERRLLLEHFRLVHSTTLKYKCSYCDWSADTEADITIHERKHTKDKPYMCVVCERRFSQFQNLKRHSKLHLSSEEVDDSSIQETAEVFPCKQCGKKFTQFTHVERHMRLHSGEKPHKCEECGAVFRERHHLKRHTRRHTGERPFKCEICKTTFCNDTTLTCHMRRHTGITPYSCDICRRGFVQIGNMRAHMVSHHNAERPYVCSECLCSFPTRQSCMIHYYQHPGTSRPRCELCDKVFLSQRYKEIHLCSDDLSRMGRKNNLGKNIPKLMS